MSEQFPCVQSEGTLGNFDVLSISTVYTVTSIGASFLCHSVARLLASQCLALCLWHLSWRLLVALILIVVNAALFRSGHTPLASLRLIFSTLCHLRCTEAAKSLKADKLHSNCVRLPTWCKSKLLANIFKPLASFYSSMTPCRTAFNALRMA